MSSYKHTRFQQGWWSCFLALVSNDYFMGNYDKTAYDTLRATGVTKGELEYVLAHEYMCDDAKKILATYLEDLKRQEQKLV